MQLGIVTVSELIDGPQTPYGVAVLVDFETWEKPWISAGAGARKFMVELTIRCWGGSVQWRQQPFAM